MSGAKDLKGIIRLCYVHFMVHQQGNIWLSYMHFVMYQCGIDGQCILDYGCHWRTCDSHAGAQTKTHKSKVEYRA